MFHGSRALTDQINAIASRTDLNNPAQRQAVMPVLSCAAHCAFDCAQDISNDSVMLEFYRVANQSVMNIATLNSDTGKLSVLDPSVKDASVVAGKTIQEATETLVDKCVGAVNNVSNFVKVLREADMARAKWIQPYFHVDGKFARLPSTLLAERELLKMIDPDKTKPFSSRIPESAISSKLGSVIEGAVEDIGGLHVLANTRRPNAKTILSGDLAKSFDVTVELYPYTTKTGGAPCVRIDSNGVCRIERADKESTMMSCNGTVELRPDAAKKLGLNVRSQSNSRGL